MGGAGALLECLQSLAFFPCDAAVVHTIPPHPPPAFPPRPVGSERAGGWGRVGEGCEAPETRGQRGGWGLGGGWAVLWGSLGELEGDETATRRPRSCPARQPLARAPTAAAVPTGLGLHCPPGQASCCCPPSPGRMEAAPTPFCRYGSSELGALGAPPRSPAIIPRAFVHASRAISAEFCPQVHSIRPSCGFRAASFALAS
jgi:hypothetical protein